MDAARVGDAVETKDGEVQGRDNNERQRRLDRELQPYTADAWYEPANVKVGYEISFNRYFYKPAPMRSLEEIRADILSEANYLQQTD